MSEQEVKVRKLELQCANAITETAKWAHEKSNLEQQEFDLCRQLGHAEASAMQMPPMSPQEVPMIELITPLYEQI